MMTTTQAWKAALVTLLQHGQPVAPLSAGAAWRGRSNRELVGFQTRIPMSAPVLLSPARKLGFKFLAAEAAWICSGDNRVATIAPYAKKIADLSDDGRRFFGAYGPRFIEQLSFAVETLRKDPASRQAVIQIWREQPRQTKDTPCTLSWQFLLRDGKLHCIATMRSSDVWTGLVYDWFNFSMVSAVVALELREQIRANLFKLTHVGAPDSEENTTEIKILHRLKNIQLGTLTLNAGSQHLYDVDADGAQACLTGDDQAIEALDLNEFASSEELIVHLWDCAQGLHHSNKRFLRELYR